MKYSFRFPMHEIVPLKNRDIDEFLELMELCFIHCNDSQKIDYYQARITLSKLNSLRSRILLKLNGIKLDTFLFKVEKKIVSASSLFTSKKQGIICNMMTHPDFRRKGFARKLLTHTIDYAQKMKLEEISLKVRSENNQAISLYEKENFEAKIIDHTIPMRNNLQKINRILDADISFYTSNEVICMQRKIIKRKKL